MNRRPTTGMAWTACYAMAVLPMVVLLLSRTPRIARAEEAWEREVRVAEQEEDRELQEARQRGTTRALVNRYASRVSRQPTALNLYLLGRALYYDGDVDGAERQLRTVLQKQPDFWPARLRMAMLEMQRERPDQAEQYVTQVLRAKPGEPGALKLLVQLRMAAKDWDRALQALEDLLSQDPTNEVIRNNIARVLIAKEDWPRALKELRVLRGRNPRDPAVRWYYASALYQTGDLKEAAREFEGLLRLDPKDVRALDMLRLIYAQTEDWKSLEKTLERMLPLVDDEEIQTRIRQMLEALKSGQHLEAQPPEAGQEWPENTWMKLIEKAMDPADVQGRRKALQTLYEGNFPRMPHALVGRVHPDYESDAICRQWLLRLMGQMQNPQLAQVTAYALYDPDLAVREKAAETLGEIATPSGLLYLMPMMLAQDLGEEPSEAQLREINAARRAMIAITGRLDPFGGTDAWIDKGRVAAVQKDWLAWLQSPEGVHARLQAIGDLQVQGDLRPELHVLEDVSDPNLDLATAAYKVLLARSKLPSEDSVATRMWPRFPVFEDAQLTEGGFGLVRAAVTAWWEEWRKTRAAARAEAGDGR